MTTARFLSLTQSKLSSCSANHRTGYFCDWLSIVWAYSEQETENRPWHDSRAGFTCANLLTDRIIQSELKHEEFLQKFHWKPLANHLWNEFQDTLQQRRQSTTLEVVLSKSATRDTAIVVGTDQSQQGHLSFIQFFHHLILCTPSLTQKTTGCFFHQDSKTPKELN